jgi:hypothetical protein
VPKGLHIHLILDDCATHGHEDVRSWGVFHSVPDLVASIQEYIDAHNDGPKPYVWTAAAESILAKVARGRIALENAGRLRGTPLASAASTLARWRNDVRQ